MGCDLLVDSLEKVGVDTIFAYPGGASMMLHQSLTRSKQIRTTDGVPSAGVSRSRPEP
ncbi:MAG: hypothetical protein EBT57_10335 [Verrucomicrobia bacterium]|nr:hypothetical protein [Verrucomicrobiota bacterium]